MVVPIDYQMYIFLDMNTLKCQFPNPATSSKQLIPLEPDFSQMSDPNVMIDPLNSTDVSQTRPSRKEQSRRDHKSKREEDISRLLPLLPLLDQTLWILLDGRRNQRDLNIHTKREKDDLLRLLLLSILLNLKLTSVDIKGLKNLRRLPVPIRPESPILIQSILNQLILRNFTRIFRKLIKSLIRRLKLKSGLSTVL